MCDPHSADTGAMMSSGHIITILMDLTWYSGVICAAVPLCLCTPSGNLLPWHRVA